MKITFRQLQIFEAAARNLSITKAAEEVHTTQPNVSMNVKQLADAIGKGPLFQQIGKRVYLTDIGHKVYKLSRDVLALLGTIEGF